MKKSKNPGPLMSSQEQVSGLIYFAFQLVFLPSILFALNGLLSRPLSKAELNFTYYLLNFFSMLLIFPNFLGRSAAQVWQHPAWFLQAVVLGLAAYYACSYVVERMVSLLMPGFINHNNEEITAMFGASPFLMVIGTVILAPPFEECIFRGLIFRSIYKTSRWAAYAVSIVSFALIHILGFWDAYSPLEIAAAVLQYLPAGLCLAWCYTKAETLFAPIVVHAAINAYTIYTLQ